MGQPKLSNYHKGECTLINITSKALEALKDGTSQKVKISVSPLKGEAFELTNENLALNGLTIKRLCVNGDEFETGTCCASTAKITLDNSRGSFNEVFFGGAVLSIKIGIEYENTVEWLQLGVYTVDEQPRKLSSITLEAYDNMVKLDIAASELPLPASRRTLVRWCIERAGLVCDDYSMFSDSSGNGGYISSVPEFSEVPTLRQLIMYCCELDGVCGHADGDGHIVFKDYGGNEAFGIDESFRYQTVNLEEADTVINGIRLISGEETYPAEITGDYIIEISSNPLFDACDNKSKCAELLNAKFAGRAYRGFSCETLSLPFLQPLDAVSFVKNSVPYSSFITNTSYTFNGKMTIESKCISQTQKGYANLGALTSAQKGILNKAKHELKKDLSNREQAIIDLNEVVNSSLGFYTTTVKDPQTGAVRLYMHDKPTLEESGTIYTRTEKGFAWTNSGWNDGDPVWNYGIDKNGNAVLNAISVNKISGEYIEGNIISGNELHIKFKSGEEEIPIEEEFEKIERDAEYLEQQFTAANGELVSSIEKVNSDLTENIGGVEKQVSDLRQTVDGLRFGISTTGGTNLIKNSVGYFDFDEWQYEGNVIVDRGLFIGKSSSRCGFVLSSVSSIFQTDIPTWNGKEYTVSFIVNQTAADKSVFTVEGAASTAKLIFADKEYSFAKQQITVTAAEALTIKFSVETGQSAISDLMCNIGSNVAVWSMAQGELYDTNFKFNNEGFTIKQSSYDGYMNIRADEIANYYQGEKTFSLNKDETEIEKLIAHKQMDMMPIKIIPITEGNEKGWAFVKLGG